MTSEDPDLVEIQVIVDVLDAVEARLRECERRGWRLTVARSRIYAAVLHAVIVSARESHWNPATLDRASVLDALFGGIEDCGGTAGMPIDEVIERHTVSAN